MNGRGLLMLGAGFAIWASAFVALYAMLTVGCRFGWHEISLADGITLQRAQLIAILFVHLAAGAALVVILRDGATFLARTAYLAALAAWASTLFSFIAILVLSPCI